LIELTKDKQVHCTEYANGRHLEAQKTTKICIKRTAGAQVHVTNTSHIHYRWAKLLRGS